MLFHTGEKKKKNLNNMYINFKKRDMKLHLGYEELVFDIGGIYSSTRKRDD